MAETIQEVFDDFRSSEKYALYDILETILTHKHLLDPMNKEQKSVIKFFIDACIDV